jgi:hypothetical protein
MLHKRMQCAAAAAAGGTVILEETMMIAAWKRAPLVLLLSVSPWAQPDYLLGQERPSPLGAVVAFVREYVPTTVPPEMRPYEVGPVFLKVTPVGSERDALGLRERRDAERLGVTLVEERWIDMLVASEGGHQVRDDGVHIVVASVDRRDGGRVGQSEGALAIEFSYYVTFRRPGRNPVVCLEEWEVVLTPVAEGDKGWEVAEANKVGHC